MNDKPEVWQGTLALMVLKTLERAGSLQWEPMTAIVASFLNPKEGLA